jgi:hypothetical protein
MERDVLGYSRVRRQSFRVELLLAAIFYVNRYRRLSVGDFPRIPAQRYSSR